MNDNFTNTVRLLLKVAPTVFQSGKFALTVKDRFKTNVTVPMVSHGEVYAGKLVAAMDRQHPRDLFDVHQLICNEGISVDMINIFVAYLACHNRPIHEVLFSNFLDIEDEYKNNFVGMTEKDIQLKTLMRTRGMLFNTVHKMLTENHKQFLVSLASAEPNWSLLNVQHLHEMPGIKWKIQNLELLKKKNRKKFEQQVELLNTKLSTIKSCVA